MHNTPDLEWASKEYQKLWEEIGLEAAPKRRSMPAVKQIEAVPSLSSLDEVRAYLGDCKRCPLSEGRQNIVFGAGNPKAQLVFVGEGPGADEDQQGLPFVGKAGQLLTRIIEAMGYTREQVYIANVVKCRPPQNRVPLPEEVLQCSPFLRHQIEVIHPKLIVALGSTAATTLLGTASSMSALRGKGHRLPWNPAILVVPTYHPAYLLRNPDAKRLVWEDMKFVKAQLS